MSPLSRSWSRALRAGSAAYLGATVAVAVLIGSYWAGHTNFPGHQHPPGTPEHTHSLFEVNGAPSVPAATVVERPAFVALLHPVLMLPSRRSTRPHGTVLARAPPGRSPARSDTRAYRLAHARTVPFHLTVTS